MPTPYDPPKSKVDDVSSAPKTYRIRTKWFHLGVSALVIGATLWALEELPFTLPAVICGTGVGALLGVNPIQMLLARRSAQAPGWWNAAFWTVFGAMMVAATVDEPTVMMTGFVALAVLVGITTCGAFFVEARYRVRAYSTAWGVGFVGEDAK